MYFLICFALNLLASRPFVYKPEDLLVYPKGASRLNAYKPSPTLPPMLIQHLFKEGLKSAASNGLYHLGRILLYIFAVPIKS